MPRNRYTGRFTAIKSAATRKTPGRLRLTRPEPSESSVLASVLGYLRYSGRIAWCERMNTGAYVIGEGRSRRFVRYGFPGCSDILGQMDDGRMLALEVKRPSGKATEAQAVFLERVSAAGGVAGIVRSIADVEALLARHPSAMGSLMWL